MTCEQCEDSLISYLDHELSSEEAAEVEGHISRCSHCQKELAELKQFSRGIHNATITFRQAIENVEAGLLNTSHQQTEDDIVRRVLQLVNSRRRTILLWGGVASFCIIVAAFLSLRPHEPGLDQLAAWGVQHYPLVDQVHTIRGDADGVRRWFREHHNVDVTPPQNVNYADLVGCKMTELESEPTPLLRFDGKQTAAVFILPAKFSGAAGRGNFNELSKDGFRIELWGEGSNMYLKVSKAL